VVKRGARGLPIVEDDFDQYRFLRLLYHMNDEYLNENWDVLKSAQGLNRPSVWPERQTITNVVAFTLMPNHMHLLLQETQTGGVSTYMRKVGQSMSNHHNEKYKQSGSLFQGSYKSKTIKSDMHLRYVSAYIMVKNVFELYPHGGIGGARHNFERAWEFAQRYEFSSLRHYTGDRIPVIDRNILEEIYEKADDYKEFARDVIIGGKWKQSEFE